MPARGMHTVTNFTQSPQPPLCWELGKELRKKSSTQTFTCCPTQFCVPVLGPPCFVHKEPMSLNFTVFTLDITSYSCFSSSLVVLMSMQHENLSCQVERNLSPLNKKGTYTKVLEFGRIWP